MKKHIPFFYLFFFICAAGFAQKEKCRSLDDAVTQTLKALETSDTALYLQLWNKEKYISTINEDPGLTGEQKKKWVERAEEMAAKHKKNFSVLLKQMKMQLATDKYEIRLVKADNYMSVPEGVTTLHGVNIIFTVNGVTRKITLVITEYKGCFYIFEPIGNMLQAG